MIIPETGGLAMDARQIRQFANDEPNMFSFIIVLVVILALCVLTVLIINNIRASRRRDALREYARRRGFSYQRWPGSGHDALYREFEIFRRGTERRATNTIAGTIECSGFECSLVMGDYQYVIERGIGEDRSRKRYRFSYLIASSPWRDAPSLLVRPEGLLDRFKAIVGCDDIDFESEDFSRKFFVSCSDRRFAYDLLDPRMIDFFLETRPPLIDFEHGRICISPLRSMWTPAEFQTEVTWVEEFFKRWPDHLVRSKREARS